MMVWHRMITRLTNDSRRSTRRRRRPLRLESMERRELLANDLAAISGFTFEDQNSNGTQDASEPVLQNVPVTLIEDTDGNGVFSNPLNDPLNGPDQLVGTVNSGPNVVNTVAGAYRFENLDGPDADSGPGKDPLFNGIYFVVQGAVPGRPDMIIPGPQMVTVTDDTGVTQQLIDDFTTVDGDGQTVTGLTGTLSESSAAANVVGQERDIRLTIVSNTETDPLLGTVALGVSTANGQLSLSTPLSAVAQALVQYDGVDADGAAITLQPTGLNGVDLDDSDPAAGLEVMIQSETVIAGGLQIRIFTDATNFSIADIDLDGTNVEQTVFVPFSAFVQGGAGPADFSNVGAIEAEIDPTVTNPDTPGLDFSVSVVNSLRSNESTVNLANIQPISLGGQIFVDNSAAGQNDGIRQSTEPGIVGVTVDLYELTNPTDVFPTNATFVTTTDTVAAGLYTFAGLLPGNYAAVIPATEFGSGQILFGFGNSTGNDPPTDPDDDIDNDDEGVVLANGDVRSGTIVLASNTEPTNDGDPPNQPDNDPNTNTTLDFGFFPQVDLSVTKTFNASASDLVNDLVVFDIVVQNAQPAGVNILDATNVTFTDTLPVGLENPQITGAAINPNDVTIVNQDVTVDLGTLLVGGSVSFQLTADISAGRTDDVTNTAVVSTLDQVDIDPANDTDDALVDVLSADLAITKIGDPTPVNAGAQLTYTITVDNNGPNDATGVVVTDTLPAGVTFNAADSVGTITENPAGSGQLQIFLGNILNGASASATIVVDVEDNAASPLTNDASVVADSPNDPDLVNNDTSTNNGTVTTPVERLVDVTLTKSVPTPADVIAGGTFTYDVTVANLGPSEARNVVVTDVLDSELTFVSFDPGTSGVTRDPADNVNLSFDVGTLPAGVANTVTFSFDVSLASSATGTIENTSNITTTDNEPIVNNATNESTVSSPINRDVDLAIVKAVNLATAIPGASLDQPPNDPDPRLIYTVDIINNGVSDAFNVIATDDLSENIPVDRLVNVSVASGTGTTSFDTVTDIASVDFGTIPAGESRQFTITADIAAQATGTIDNDAIVDADDTNPVPSNTVTTTLTPNFDLTIDKTRVGNASIGPNDEVTFNLVVSHDTAGNETSPSTATGVIISDDLPADLTFVAATFNGSAITLTPDANGDVVFPAFDLNPGDTRTATIVARAGAAANGLLTNNTSITTDTGETDTTNNSDSDTVTVDPVVDVTIAKSVSALNAQAGNSLTYTITATNDGPSIADNVTIIDSLPAGVTFSSGSGPNGEVLSANNGVVTFNGGTLANTATFTITINGTVAAGTSGVQVNSASVSTSTNESNANNNTATAQTDIDPMTSSIAGTIYVDANNNGVLDSGELPIAGVTLTLNGTDTLGNTVSATATTLADGSYLFGGLAAGTYSVTETQPPGFRDGQETAGTGANATVADDVFTQLGLGVATNADGFNFGELNEPLSKRRFLASS